jgi:hypothetical protein
MKNNNFKIMHQHFSICKGDEDQSFSNYFIIFEIIDSVPQQPYIVDMHNYIFYDENMPYYVINKN